MPYQSEFRPGLFAGKTVIVTGGGSGIGRCTAHELASLGAHVAIIGRKIEKLDHVKGEIEEDGGMVSAYVCDIRDEPGIQAMVDAVLATTGRIDGLVNNAGGQYRSNLETISTKGFEAVVKNNLTGGFIVMREVFNRWMKDHGGAVVNIIADISNGWPMFGHSAAARGGMLTLSESAACEWAQYGVRVNALAPGGIASSGFEVYDEASWAQVRTVAAKVPMQRFGNESEVSAGIVFLLSPAASYITGTCLRIDGGSPNARATFDVTPHDRAVAYQGFHRAKATRT
jgi:citronellol/citronellal dehydrogenase